MALGHSADATIGFFRSFICHTLEDLRMRVLCVFEVISSFEMKEVFKPFCRKIVRAGEFAQFQRVCRAPLSSLKDFRWRMAILEDSPLGYSSLG